jgi:hypothetical protein
MSYLGYPSSISRGIPERRFLVHLYSEQEGVKAMHWQSEELRSCHQQGLAPAQAPQPARRHA